MGFSQRFACKVVGQPLSINGKSVRRIPLTTRTPICGNRLRDWASECWQAISSAVDGLLCHRLSDQQEEDSAPLARRRTTGEGPRYP